MAMYDFEIKRINQEIKKRKATRVLVQLPEGLKSEFLKIAEKINAEVVLSGDPCFGACDVQTMPETDFTIHFGHSKMVESPDIVYVEAHADIDATKTIEEAVRLLTGKRIGLVTSVQHVGELAKAKKIIEKMGKKAVVGGPVLGCDQTNAKSIAGKVDEFLFIGSGRFHGLGVMYATEKKVLLADPYSHKIEGLDPMQVYKEKYIRKEKAQNAMVFGVIVGTKPGQKKMDVAERVKKKLEKKGKRAYLIVMNEITPERLDYLPFDAYVVTACPRIVIDDWKNYKKPVLLPEEL
jgi:2-(3-amino-3-carboxypropyl)histidine synthase